MEAIESNAFGLMIFLILVSAVVVGYNLYYEAVFRLRRKISYKSYTYFKPMYLCKMNYVNIGADCMILDTDCHSLNWSQRGLRGGCDEQGQSIDQLNTKTAPVVIEDDVMLGARSIVLKGVTIGRNSQMNHIA